MSSLFARRGQFLGKLLEGDATAWIILVVVVLVMVGGPILWRYLTQPKPKSRRDEDLD